jgi:hypothetical protein
VPELNVSPVKLLQGREPSLTVRFSWSLAGVKSFILRQNRTCWDSTVQRQPHHTMSSSKAEGRREDALAKQRTQMREEFERQKQSLINETEKARPSSNRFVGQNESIEETLKHKTVGLVKLEEFQQRRKELEEAKAREAARTNELK